MFFMSLWQRLALALVTAGIAVLVAAWALAA